jgi:ABC-type sugar transport system ATPase subunit
MSSLELMSVTVSRGERRLLDAVDLAVATAERVVILGPSGSGKTTLLRTVAGLEQHVTGTIRIDGRDVTALQPRDRGVSMVNQEASLQPHLDVGSNVAFPLRIRRVPRDEVAERVLAEARAFAFRDLLQRRPSTLSAGERHEVALARSLVRRPELLLLDEPLARADAPRRSVLLRELIAVQQGYGVTLLVATNDQRVAMSLAHRIAVLDDGRLVQVGTPGEVFRRPGTAFVAGFLGTPAMNLLRGRVTRARAGVRVEAGPIRVTSFRPEVSDLAGREVIVGIRPTDLDRVDAHDEGLLVIEEPVLRRAFLGSEIEVGLDAGDGRELTAIVDRPAPETGSLLRLRADPAQVHLFALDGPALAHGV